MQLAFIISVSVTVRAHMEVCPFLSRLHCFLLAGKWCLVTGIAPI